MRADEAWGARWRSCAHPLSHRFMETAAEKGTLVVLAADLGSTEELVSLIQQVGPHIAALKTHVDMVEDFSQESWQDVVDAAHSHDLMLFEDRKFADIGRVSQTQMGGIYDIRSWADIVTAHSVSGSLSAGSDVESWQPALRGLHRRDDCDRCRFAPCSRLHRQRQLA